MPHNKRLVVRKVLGELSNIPRKERPRNALPDGGLDIDAFNQLPQVVNAINKLKDLGVYRKDLIEAGFWAAVLVLRY